MGRACNERGLGKLGVLYWLTLQHGLVVSGERHELRVNVDAALVAMPVS